MGKNVPVQGPEAPETAAPVSPKVTSSTVGGAFATVVAWVLTQLPLVQDAPVAVQGAVAVLIIAAGTFAAGYIKRDPARD